MAQVSLNLAVSGYIFNAMINSTLKVLATWLMKCYNSQHFGEHIHSIENNFIVSERGGSHLWKLYHTFFPFDLFYFQAAKKDS